MNILRISACACALFLLSCSSAPSTAERTELALGTVCSVRVLDGASEKALDDAFARLAAIEAEMSANDPGTLVDQVNQAAGGQAVAVPDDLRYVTRKALEYAALSDGAFDPTIGPLVKLWGIGTEDERVPSADEVSVALAMVDRWLLELDDQAGTLRLAKPGMRLDLGAIAKGYAADEAGRILAEQGVTAAVIDLGGNVKVVGRKPDGSPWKIGVQNPFDDRGAYIGIVTVTGDRTVVTSGVYERYFLGDDGTHYHHILDTRTGYPVRNGLASVTIIASSSIDADGLSTTLFALGLDKGLALANSLDWMEAVFIDEDKRVYLSDGAQAIFELTDDAFVLAQADLREPSLSDTNTQGAPSEVQTPTSP
ncbi:MAG TPA: FAD:protein FMN transferase [Spirochaetales bacterium]|nr:FAD:protein FMN transferase [Spirochaetales bacterium]